MVRRISLPLALVMLSSATSAFAQTAKPSTIAVDTAVAIDQSADEYGGTTGTFIDSVISAKLGGGFETIVRPYMQLLATGEWNKQIWLATLRYERAGRVGIRVDGGLIPPPVGYANLQLRPQLNPTIGQPMSLFTALPAVETRGPRAMLLGAVYPYGTNVTLSSRWWDARVAVMDVSPMRPRRIFALTNPPRFMNVVLGGGVTPIFGLRVGASITRGGWQRAGESPAITVDRDATVMTVESEYSIRYTKIGGEWTRDALETGHGHTAARGWFVQGQQTLTPRWFVAARAERMNAPALVAATGAFDRQQYRGTEEVIGFRVTPEITFRVGHRARQIFGDDELEHAASLSIVWWRRWR